MRTGLIAKKLGMTRIFENDQHIPTTVLKIDNATVVSTRTQKTDGYDAVVVGIEDAKQNRVAKAQKAQYNKAKIPLRKKVAEFRVSATNLVETGKEILASHFVDGQFVDVTATSIGKGFAGGMKRHGFAGLEATHGVSISHRSHGSTGHCQDPGRVFKGKKMAGHMGNTQVTTQNLQIIRTDDEQGLIFVKGAVPGSKGGYVKIKDAIKFPIHMQATLPAKIKGAQAKEATKAEEQVTQTEENKA